MEHQEIYEWLKELAFKNCDKENKEQIFWFFEDILEDEIKVEKQEEEIERLNNIISKLNHKMKTLDDFVEREIELYTVELTEENKNILGYTAPILSVYKEIHNILNSLKGSDKE